MSAESVYSLGNNQRDTIAPYSPIIDSLLLSDKLKWSARLVSNFKLHPFRLKNENSTLKYKPNNPYGIGFGLANQKIVIDIILNIKTNVDRNHTKKFAMEGSFSFKRNFIAFFVESVHGYHVKNNFNELENFRKDISLFSASLNYLRILSKKPFSVQHMKGGFPKAHKSTVVFGVGGFLITDKLDSDRSIVPIYAEDNFNDEAQITNLTSIGGGISGGIFSYINLPSKFFLTLNAAPGIGLLHKEVKTETSKYTPSNPLLYRLDGFAALGFNGKRMYAHFNYGAAFYGTSLDNGNSIVYNVTKSKIIIGYRL